MNLKNKVKTVIEKLDRYSPYPLFYPFLMSNDEKAFFDSVIKNSQVYLEFGLGGSSLRAIQKSKAKIYTVESSPDWIKYLRKYTIVRCYENKRLFISSVDIGPIRGWGYPKANNPQNLFESYSSSIFKLIDSKVIDLALVDGRFRVACTLKIILECHNSSLKILIHDFWNRKEYHVLLKYLDTMDKVDTLGLFSVKENVDRKSVESDYETYKNNPS